MLNLETQIEKVPNIGLIYQKKLKKLGIKTIKDLIFYFPNRYEDFSEISPINKLKPNELVCVRGKIIAIEGSRSFRKWIHITQAVVEDESGLIKTLWFNQPYLLKSLKEDDLVYLAGKVSLGKDGIYLQNPIHEKVDELEDDDLTHTGRIIPIYGETKGLTSRWLRYVIKPLLEYFSDKIPETLPPYILAKYKLLPIKKAIWQVHFPDSFDYADAAKSRFSFENLFLIQLLMLKERFKIMKKSSYSCPMNAKIMKQFTDSLPFKLTDSQRQCSYQILKDLEKPFPMSRLLQGDVGSGKTVVAAMAILNVGKNGYQAAFMSPTEILANQHFKNLIFLLGSFNLTIGYLSGKESKIFFDGKIENISPKNLLTKLESGQINLIIGTHSLIQKKVHFKNLALVVVDEQHRFGVNQRSELIKKNKIIPHLLSMTATPIPRTLALTIYGDLDLSLIKEMPKNRKKVKTVIVSPKDRKSAYEFIRSEVKKGKGVFVICPKIEPKQPMNLILNNNFFNISNYSFKFSNFAEIKSVKDEYEKLSKNIFPDLRIATLHGKMKPKEKEKIMADFKDGKIDILISTSVVEVGVDIPRATVMMIEGAERFGLAQLHQFRGRVGRSDAQSYCFLFTTEPSQLNRERLKAMVTLDNGFELAQKDLEIRGPGQLYGLNQWGLPDIAMEGIFNVFLVEKTRSAAKELLEKDPELNNWIFLRERLENFKNQIHFE